MCAATFLSPRPLRQLYSQLPMSQNAMQHRYSSAVRLLRSRSRLAKATNKPDEPRLNIPNNYGMVEWLEQLGHTASGKLRIIHITGTKGKGSTAAFTASLLRAHFARLNQPVKIGLYTSPHVLTERDRIRIDFAPVSESLFASAFFHIWHTLRCDQPGYKPGYLQLLALLSVHIFIQQGVDIAVYEVHAGGRKDATNIFPRPLACGFARIGMDHADLLGPDVESIAWHKSGIMKKDRPAFSVKQETVPKTVLKEQADEIGAPLHEVDVYEDLPTHPNVGQPAQRENASLAIALTNAALAERGQTLSADDIEVGITTCAWPGRFQHLQRDGVHWFLDSAHNELSIPVAMSWFKSLAASIQEQNASQNVRRILVFGHASERSTERLVDVLLESASENDLAFHQVILSSYNRYDIPICGGVASEQLRFWRTRDLNVSIEHAITADTAVRMIKKLQQQSPDTHFQVLITGSTHLVGQSLDALGGEELVMTST